MYSVGVTSTSFSKNPKLRDELLALIKDVRFNDSGHSLIGAELQTFLRDRDAVIVGLEKVDEALLEACPNLKVVAKYGVGLDNVDLEACRRRSIQIGWTSGVNAYAVAEQTLGLMIGLSRRLFQTATALRSGVWDKNGGFEIRGKTIGIIGVGHVGSEVMRLAHAFGAHILANDVRDVNDIATKYGATLVSKEEIFSACDIVTLHVPLTLETKNLVDEKSLSRMKTTALLINTSRGGVVDQVALKNSLKAKRIGGAALDVFESEPCDDIELLSLENFVGTPHICGNSSEAVLAMGRAAISNLKRGLNL